MKAYVRGAAVLITAAAALIGGTAFAEDKTVLSTERDKTSYMVGLDVANSISPVAPDMDQAAFERAIKNAFDGGKPLLDEAESRATGEALMARINARNAQAQPPAADGKPATPPAKPAEVAKDKVGYLVGSDVGRSLASIKSEIDLDTLFQAVRTQFAKGKSLLSEAEATTVRDAFRNRLRTKAEADQAAAGQKNAAEGTAFLAKNKAEKGVITTGSGLQYLVLRPGSGPQPKATDRVRVNYKGTLLDGTTFDSSYDRGQPAEFALNQVIPGWTEGVAKMSVGSKFRFWIPAELAYGAKGSPGGIGPNSTLVFEVELMAIL